MVPAANPFGVLRLSPGDAASLKDLTQAFVAQKVLNYERYVDREQRHLDKSRWKFTAQNEDVRVFTEQHNRERGRSAPMVMAAAHADEMHSPHKFAGVPSMLVVGTLQGSVEDTIFGLMTHTRDTMHLRSFYMGDQLTRSAMLATLESPSSAHPFQSHTIKWAAAPHPPVLRGLVRNRDFVFMEATGFAELHSGEKVGYHLLHSVHFPTTRELPGIVRGNLSICGLYRQRGDGTVEVFANFMLDPCGSVPRSLAIKLAAASLLACSNVARCARAKKLAWLLACRDRDSDATTMSVDVCSMSEVSGDTVCTSCYGYPVMFGTKLGECSLCLRPLCSRCKQKEELGVVARNGSVHRRKMGFCAGCLGNLEHVSARTVIYDKFVAPRMGMNPWSGNASFEAHKLRPA